MNELPANEYKKTSTLLAPLLCALTVAALMLFSAIGEGRGGTTPAKATVAAALMPPDVSAEAYIVRFVGDERPVLERRADKPLAPASLTKIMTAVAAAEKLAPGDTGVMTAFAKAVEERKSPAREGEEFSRDDLLRAALVMSANDAALTLAERVGEQYGGIAEECGDIVPRVPCIQQRATSAAERHVAAFVRLMNAKSRILGMDATHFENPTGLDMPGHVSTARDLARMAEYVFGRYPALWEMTRRQEVEIAAIGGGAYTLANSNPLLAEFPGLAGGKTGLTDRAKEALMLLYPAGENRIAVIVILRSDDRFGDGRKIIRWLEENF